MSDFVWRTATEGRVVVFNMNITADALRLLSLPDKLPTFMQLSSQCYDIRNDAACGANDEGMQKQQESLL